MSETEKWYVKNQDALAKSAFGFQTGYFDFTEPLALYTRENSKTQNDVSRNETKFLSILPWRDDVFEPSYLQNESSAIFLKEQWPENLSSTDQSVFLGLSPGLTTFKKALLADRKYKTINLGIDPYSLGLWKSWLYKWNFDESIFASLQEGDQVFRFSTQAYAMSGASDHQQLAILLASIVETLWAFEDRLSHEDIFKQISLEVTLKSHFVLGASKLRALRLLLDQLMEVYGVQGVTLPIYTTASWRHLSAREPWNNLMRLTAVDAISHWGCADGVFANSFDLYSKSEGYRLSRNIDVIAQRESYLNQVMDPFRGSFTVETVSEDLAEKAWQLFQEIQRKDGLLASLRSSWLHDEIKEAEKKESHNFLARKIKITGVNQFVLKTSLDEQYPLLKETDVVEIETLWMNNTIEDGIERLCDVERLVPSSLCSKMEKWQFQADRLRNHDADKVSIPFLYEEGLQQSKKALIAKEILGLAGLDSCSVNSAEGQDLLVVVASAPDSEWVKTLIAEKNSRTKLLWAGEKQLDGFASFVGQGSSLEELYTMIFSKLGAK